MSTGINWGKWKKRDEKWKDKYRKITEEEREKRAKRREHCICLVVAEYYKNYVRDYKLYSNPALFINLLTLGKCHTDSIKCHSLIFISGL